MDGSVRKPRGDTAEKILDLGEMLIQTRGFNAFSYQDISTALGIRKASIHYHFPSKSDLGAAVLDRYRSRLYAAMAGVDPDAMTSWNILETYFTPYLGYAKTPDRVCLCGALAGEFPALPPDMQTHVTAFFEEHQAWLATILKRGRGSGEFRFSASPAKMARLIFDALQGALLVKRTNGDIRQIKDVIQVFKAIVMPS